MCDYLCLGHEAFSSYARLCSVAVVSLYDMVPPPPLEAGHNQVNTDLWGKYLLISKSRRANLGITGGTHHPHHEVGEDGDPQSGQDERQHEAFLPASFGTVGDGKIEQQEQRP